MEHLYAILRIRFSCVSMIFIKSCTCILHAMQLNIYHNHTSLALCWTQLTYSTL